MAQENIAENVTAEVAAAGSKLLAEPAASILIKVGMTILILFIGYLMICVLAGILKRGLKKTKMDEVLHTFFLNCLKMILWIVILITALSYLGISPMSLLTVLGAAGVAVALALKDSLSNFAGGILIIISKPFSKGDLIEDMQISGKVEEIDLLYTTLITFDNKVITVPNGKLANSTIINYSRERKRRVDCRFSVSYDTEIELVKEILETVAAANPKALREPEPSIGVASLNERAVEFDLRVWCMTEDYWEVYYSLQEQVKLAFDVHHISIPYPQMDVHIKK